MKKRKCFKWLIVFAFVIICIVIFKIVAYHNLKVPLVTPVGEPVPQFVFFSDVRSLANKYRIDVDPTFYRRTPEIINERLIPLEYGYTLEHDGIEWVTDKISLNIRTEKDKRIRKYPIEVKFAMVVLDYISNRQMWDEIDYIRLVGGEYQGLTVAGEYKFKISMIEFQEMKQQLSITDGLTDNDFNCLANLWVAKHNYSRPPAHQVFSLYTTN